MTQAAIETATFQFVAHHLTHCATCIPHYCVLLNGNNKQAYIVFDVWRERSTSETSANIYQSALRNVPQEFDLHQYRSENFKTNIMRAGLKLSLVVSERWARKSKNPFQNSITGHRAVLPTLSS